MLWTNPTSTSRIKSFEGAHDADRGAVSGRFRVEIFSTPQRSLKAGDQLHLFYLFFFRGLQSNDPKNMSTCEHAGDIPMFFPNDLQNLSPSLTGVILPVFHSLKGLSFLQLSSGWGI